MTPALALLACAALLSPAPQGAFGRAAPVYTEDTTVWPNAISKANSDPWLVENHDRVRKMEPRVLVLNFANGYPNAKAEATARSLCAALTDSTRYHGYADPKAEPFVEWQLAGVLDLTDPEPFPETPDGNSTRYPRKPDWVEGINFVYRDLYDAKFAAYYGIEDPAEPGRFLTLDQLVDRGIVHELWFFAFQKSAGAPFECTELKPVYDAELRRVPGQFRHAGNGGDPGEPWHGRSLRINFLNCERGIGCGMENLGHALEGMAHAGVIPYFRRYFYEFASFDLDRRWHLPFNSFYALWGEGKGISYPDPHTAVVTDGERTFELDDYYCIGGNVHFTPNGRGHYDLQSPSPVMSTIEHWRLRDGPDGADEAEPWTVDKLERYRELAPDCMGAWQVYWRQNMPGYRSPIRDDDGERMKCWWVFLFY